MLKFRNQNVNHFTESILLITFVFRLFVIFIIGAFIYERSGTSESLLLGCAIGFAIVFIDLFFTVRRFWSCMQTSWEWPLGIVIKLGLFSLAVVYALSIWMKINYWLYPTFGFFVAFLIGLDFLLVKHNQKKPS